MKGESTIWNLLMSAAGASFVTVAVALVIVANQSSEQPAADAADAALDAPAEGAAPDGAAEAVAVGTASAALPAAPGVDASTGAELDASRAAEDLADARPEEDDEAFGAAAASAQPQPPTKTQTTKTKQTKRKTKRR